MNKPLTLAVRICLELNDIRAGRGKYASLSASQRILLANDVAARRVAI